MAAVISNPDGPAPIPKYKTARQNLEAVVYGAGGIFGGHGGWRIRRVGTRMRWCWRGC